jgi:hypothetical protein
MHHRVLATLSLCVLAAAHTGCATAVVAAFQPENIGGETIVLTTTDAGGESHERVLSPIAYESRLFVAANHWPRAWYHRALENPEVSVTRNGETTDYRAVPVSEEERERLLAAPGFPLVAYVFTGFAPWQFLRLDPRLAALAPPGGAREPGRASGRAARSSAIRGRGAGDAEVPTVSGRNLVGFPVPGANSPGRRSLF